MKRLRRDSLKFDAFSLFSNFLEVSGAAIDDEGATRRFIEELMRNNTAARQSPTFLYGQRTENLFELIVASLGEVKAFKREDAGELYYSTEAEMQPADFRVVLHDGRQLLVEVKNFHKRDVDSPQVFQSAYVEKLQCYAEAFGAELYFATFWSAWGLWTLIPERRLPKGKRRKLRLLDALAANEMYLVGDKSLGTRAPLRFCAAFDPIASTLTADGTDQQLAIRSVQLYSEDRLLEDPVELALATFLIQFGDWVEADPITTTNPEASVDT